MKKYLAVCHTEQMGYCFCGKGAKKYVPALKPFRKNYGTLKEFAKKFGYTYNRCIEKSDWVARLEMKIFAVEVA